MAVLRLPVLLLYARLLSVARRLPQQTDAALNRESFGLGEQPSLPQAWTALEAWKAKVWLQQHDGIRSSHRVHPKAGHSPARLKSRPHRHEIWTKVGQKGQRQGGKHTCIESQARAAAAATAPTKPRRAWRKLAQKHTHEERERERDGGLVLVLWTRPRLVTWLAVPSNSPLT